ncbi:MAG: MFS transporter [Gemmatimonadetes bacterium]|nr:MFS transporter [Gemmatimonadota bacterium]
MSRPDPYASLRFPEFSFFLVLRFILVFAWAMQFVVIEWQIYSLTKDPLSLGFIGLAEVIPAVSLALLAGHYVDRLEKRALLLKCVLGFLSISAGLFLVTWPPLADRLPTRTIVLAIYALVFWGGVVRSFLGPTVFSLFGQLIPREHYQNAATWSSSAWMIGSVLGPAVGGLAIVWLGVHWSLLVVALCAVVALFFTVRIPSRPAPPPPKHDSIRTSLAEGLSFVFRTKVVLGAITLDMFAVLFGGAVALLPIFAQDILHVGSTGFGLLRAAPAVGSFLIMMTVAHFPLNHRAGVKLLGAVLAFGACIIVFGLSTSFWISLAALFVSGIADGVSVVIRQTILQLRTPDEMRGRVAAVNSIFVGSSNELGAFESGLAARLMGTVPSVVFGGTMTLLIVVFTALTSPSMRRLELTPSAGAGD